MYGILIPHNSLSRMLCCFYFFSFNDISRTLTELCGTLLSSEFFFYLSIHLAGFYHLSFFILLKIHFSHIIRPDYSSPSFFPSKFLTTPLPSRPTPFLSLMRKQTGFYRIIIDKQKRTHQNWTKQTKRRKKAQEKLQEIEICVFTCSGIPQNH